MCHTNTPALFHDIATRGGGGAGGGAVVVGGGGFGVGLTTVVVTGGGGAACGCFFGPVFMKKPSMDATKSTLMPAAAKRVGAVMTRDAQGRTGSSSS